MRRRRSNWAARADSGTASRRCTRARGPARLPWRPRFKMQICILLGRPGPQRRVLGLAHEIFSNGAHGSHGLLDELHPSRQVDGMNFPRRKRWKRWVVGRSARRHARLYAVNESDFQELMEWRHLTVRLPQRPQVRFKSNGAEQKSSPNRILFSTTPPLTEKRGINEPRGPTYANSRRTYNGASPVESIRRLRLGARTEDSGGPARSTPPPIFLGCCKSSSRQTGGPRGRPQLKAKPARQRPFVGAPDGGHAGSKLGGFRSASSQERRSQARGKTIPPKLMSSQSSRNAARHFSSKRHLDHPLDSPAPRSRRSGLVRVGELIPAVLEEAMAARRRQLLSGKETA